MRRTYLLVAVLALTLTLAGCCSGSGSGSLLDLSTPWGDLDVGDRRDDRMPPKPAPAPAAKKADDASP